MKTYILDAHPLLVFFRKQEGWEKIGDLLTADPRSPKRFLLCLVNWGEIYYNVLRDEGEITLNLVLDAIENLKIEIVQIDQNLTIQAACYKSGGGISYSDCFAAALAKRESAILVTGDPEFETIEKTKEIKILWI